eukprot:TRINITY_DN19610_c0_g1_i3.p1 TRINITY_DN19610_c0_g1~~TRINITY_DN19610_c0_g1_i3.p1  ORF type:complete len:502 (-),score=74.77 TRINITY_DN19610_c0_g1_i3:149-1618(-)
MSIYFLFWSLFVLCCLPSSVIADSTEARIPELLAKSEMTEQQSEKLLKSFLSGGMGCQNYPLTCAQAGLSMVPNHPAFIEWIGKLTNEEMLHDDAVDAIRRANQYSKKMSMEKSRLKRLEEEKKKGKGSKTPKTEFYTEDDLKKALAIVSHALQQYEEYPKIDSKKIFDLPAPRVITPFVNLIHEYDDIIGSDDNAQIAKKLVPQVMHYYEKLKTTERPPDVVNPTLEDYNNFFFQAQRQKYMKSGGLTVFEDNPAFKTLQSAMRSAAGEMLVQSGMDPKEAEIWSQTHSLFVWAGVHGRGSRHGTHDHKLNAVSGVYYLQVPENSARLVFSDPRGISSFGDHDSADELDREADSFAHTAAEIAKEYAQTANLPLGFYQDVILPNCSNAAREAFRSFTPKRFDDLSPPPLPSPPFHRPYAVDVKAGKMVVFPSWMMHEVEMNEKIADGSLRIAFSFNLKGSWDATSSVGLDLGRYKSHQQRKQKQRQEL